VPRWCTTWQAQWRGDVIDLRGKTVEVTANNILYKGVLVEIDETDVYLQAESGWIVIPLEQVASIREEK
jgi:hypothetical protein